MDHHAVRDHAVGKDCGMRKVRNTVTKNRSIWNVCDGVDRNRGVGYIRDRVDRNHTIGHIHDGDDRHVADSFALRFRWRRCDRRRNR
jgi:hypothetical protein